MSDKALIESETQAPAVFNPLDANPAQFSQALVSRSENYDALAMHLRSILVPDKDFGRIHIAKRDKCPRPWECSPAAQPGHWSPYRLFSSGGDKILGLLGLGVTYPDEQDYRRAALSGTKIEDVVLKAFIDNGRGQVIAEGLGAASRSQESGDLNRTMKKAGKRARLDAVHRLPAISALFEDDFLAEIAAKAGNGQNHTTTRQRQPKADYNTGAELETWPLGGKLKGQRFADMDEGALEWIVREFDAKPDIKAAAVRELNRRQSVADEPESPQAAPGEPVAPHTADFDDDIPF